MLLNEKDAIRLRHMLDAATDATAIAAGRTREDLSADKQFALSVTRCLEIIGEAAGKVSEEVRSNTRSIPWADMVGMRNRLVHAYYDVNLTIVWKTLNEELPVLIEEIRRVLSYG